MTKRRIHENIWGNWYGYEGTRRVADLGCDEIVAGHWLLTGENSRLAGYESDATIKAAKDAANRSKTR